MALYLVCGRAESGVVKRGQAHPVTHHGPKGVGRIADMGRRRRAGPPARPRLVHEVRLVADRPGQRRQRLRIEIGKECREPLHRRLGMRETKRRDARAVGAELGDEDRHEVGIAPKWCSHSASRCAGRPLKWIGMGRIRERADVGDAISRVAERRQVYAQSSPPTTMSVSSAPALRMVCTQASASSFDGVQGTLWGSLKIEDACARPP